MFSLARSVVRVGLPARTAMYSMRFYHDLVIDHYEHPRNVGKTLAVCVVITRFVRSE